MPASDAPASIQLATDLEQLLRDRLRRFPHRTSRATGLRRAAVALTLLDEALGADVPGLPTQGTPSSRAAVLLTRRATSLRSHAGQWALPGGRQDDGESAPQAALRELEEEVGLRVGADSVLGLLDDFVTRSGYVMTPVVVWAGRVVLLSPNAAEVGSVHRIPADEFLRTDAPWLEPMQGQAHPVLRMPVGDTWIAAPTAAILYQFREVCLLGRQTRVAHFEQPRFAWR
ncbi:MAG: CoA pyrophosphatase [Rubrivivax sp.]|nr:CoA pyrophosphatase [Rubrivivax sp.]